MVIIIRRIVIKMVVSVIIRSVYIVPIKTMSKSPMISPITSVTIILIPVIPIVVS